MRKFIFIFSLLILAVFMPVTASAASSEFAISATVPEARVIYVDSRGNIDRIETNTSANITPTLISESTNLVVAPSPEILNQYQEMLAYYGGLQAGNTYKQPSIWQKIVNFAVPKISALARYF